MLRCNLSSQQPAECYTKREKKCGAWRQAKQKATTQQKRGVNNHVCYSAEIKRYLLL